MQHLITSLKWGRKVIRQQPIIFDPTETRCAARKCFYVKNATDDTVAFYVVSVAAPRIEADDSMNMLLMKSALREN
jgi:hypothetical protein